MTVIDHFPPDAAPRRTPRGTTGWQPRQDRRHEIVTTGGMEGVLLVGAALTGHQVHEFVADVRDGVPYASVTCTVALTAAEAALLAARLREVPAVIAVDLR